MAVPEQTPIARWKGNGITKSFAFQFKLRAADDLIVQVNGVAMALNVDYTIVGVGSVSGGTVSFVDAPAANSDVEAFRAMRLQRLTDYQNLGDFDSDVVNPDFDAAAEMAQDNRMLLNELADSMIELPSVADRAGKVLGFDSEGNPEAVLDVPVGALTLANVVAVMPALQLTDAEVAAGQTPSGMSYPPQQSQLKRYGAAGDNNGTVGHGTDDTAALTAARTSNVGLPLDGGGRHYRVSVALPAPSIPAGLIIHNGDVVSDQRVTAQDEYSVTVFGFGALQANTYIPEQHAASGGRYFASGNHLVAIGRDAMKSNTTGRRNTAVGSRAMLANTSGYYNTAFGSHALENGTIGYENTAIGVQTLQALTDGHGNTAVGHGACLGVSTGEFNTGVGYSACGGENGGGQTTGGYNSGIGYRALTKLTSGLDNSAIGREALVSLTSGNNNTANGSTALTSCLTGNNNSAIGNAALRSALGSDHTAVGAQALYSITTGLAGTAIGYQAGYLATGDYIVAIGHRALNNMTTGNGNVAAGRNAGTTITTGSYNTFFGYSADGIAAGDNQTAIGNGAACTASNQVTLGNASVATLRCQVTTITALSDARYKTKIRTLGLGMNLIEMLRPADFEWNARSGRAGHREAGFIAQELRAAAAAVGAEWLQLVDETNPDRLEATPGKLLPVIVAALQDLSAELKEVKRGIRH